VVAGGGLRSADRGHGPRRPSWPHPGLLPSAGGCPAVGSGGAPPPFFGRAPGCPCPRPGGPHAPGVGPPRPGSTADGLPRGPAPVAADPSPPHPVHRLRKRGRASGPSRSPVGFADRSQPSASPDV